MISHFYIFFTLNPVCGLLKSLSLPKSTKVWPVKWQSWEYFCFDRKNFGGLSRYSTESLEGGFDEEESSYGWSYIILSIKIVHQNHFEAFKSSSKFHEYCMFQSKDIFSVRCFISIIYFVGYSLESLKYTIERVYQNTELSRRQWLFFNICSNFVSM